MQKHFPSSHVVPLVAFLTFFFNTLLYIQSTSMAALPVSKSLSTSSNTLCFFLLVSTLFLPPSLCLYSCSVLSARPRQRSVYFSPRMKVCPSLSVNTASLNLICRHFVKTRIVWLRSLITYVCINLALGGSDCQICLHGSWNDGGWLCVKAERERW